MSDKGVDHRNPLDLKIGQWISITHTSYVEYTNACLNPDAPVQEHKYSNEREHIRTAFSKNPVVVVGACYRCTGTYVPATIHDHIFEEPTEARLKVKNRILFYQVKKPDDVHGKVMLVHPDDVATQL